MDRVFQIFITSTDADLKDERQAVSNTRAKAGTCPPASKSFPVTDQQQLDYIKRIIDRSDYYIMIVGRRCGSLSGDELTFTQNAFEYTQSKGIPILAFLPENPGGIACGTETEAPLKERLDAFKARLKTGRIVESWSNENDLCMKVVMAVATAVNLKPGVGWIRGDQAINPSFSRSWKSCKSRIRICVKSLPLSIVTSHHLVGLQMGWPTQLRWNCLSIERKKGHRTRSRTRFYWATFLPGSMAISSKAHQKHTFGSLLDFGTGRNFTFLIIANLATGARVIRDKLEALGLIKSRSIIAGFSIHIAWSLTEKGRRFPELGHIPIGHSGSET